MTIVVVGKNSLMGTELQKRFPGSEWLHLSHKEALENLSWADKATCVINFAFSPVLRSRAYTEKEDIDFRLAQMAGRQAHYIMMSSRTVYGTAISNKLIETDTPHPKTFYAQNKWHIEQNLTDFCADRLTILRGANVFGHEFGRTSFFGMALTNLKNMGQIVFDMAPAVKRDFIAAWHVADALALIARNPKAGLFNLGSGYGTACADIGSWIIEGYGSGDIISTNDERRDDFYLDMTKTKSVFGVADITPDMMRDDCRNCGETLKGISL